MTQSLSRRNFLIRTGLVGCSAAASPFVTPMTLAAAPWDNRLVVIILRGAMDGLDLVRPEGDPEYQWLRPTLAEGGPTTPLDDYFTLNRHASALAPMIRAGELGFVHAVSTPYRDKRSHFDGQDLLESGTGMDVAIGARRDGWLNRMLQSVPGTSAQTAFAVGREDLIVLSGAAPVSNWSPDSRLDLSPQGRRLLEAMYHDDPVFRAAGDEAMMLADLLHVSGDGLAEGETGDDMMAAMASANKSARAKSLAAFAADRLNEETRIAAFSIGGWDTHRTQLNGIKRPIDELADALVTLKSGLGRNWSKTAVLAMTEFGRTARENGSRGTDHGTAGAMVIAGGAVRGGKVFGRWPGIGEGQLYSDRDLMPTGDVRAYAAHTMRGLFGLNRPLLEDSIFPGLDMKDGGSILG